MKKLAMTLWILGLCVQGSWGEEGKPATEPLTKAELFCALPEFCPTPDGFARAPWGDILLSCPNYADPSHPAVILRITPDKKVRLWAICPIDPATGFAGPMGMEFGPDGNLYIADNQGWQYTERMGRVLRILVNEQHRPVGCEVVAYNFAHPNGIRIRDGYIYVSHSMIEKDADGKLLSGVYRFPLDAKDVKVENSVRDPHVFGVLKTENPDCQYGLDGMCFDKEGNLYLGNFGDGSIFKVTFNEKGEPSEPTLFAKGTEMISNDGMIYGDDGNIYLCDFSQNAVLAVTPEGKIITIAKNGDTDGADGSLDEPGDLIQDGKTLIISNFDNVPGPPHVNQKHDKPYTLSIISLEGLEIR
ncbi:MAG: phage head-tail adapter protein [Planctomycetia bacterium]|nr:phage head-tail adapter protein [Planctomycetia bacterium]